MARPVELVMPKHRIFIEPFAGGASLYFMKYNLAEVNVLNDFDQFVYNAYVVVQSWPELKIKVFKEPWHLLRGSERAKRIAFRCIKNEAQHYKIDSYPDIRGFFLFYVRMRFGFNCNAWSPSDRLLKGKDIDVDVLFSHFDACYEKMKEENVQLYCDDWADVMMKYNEEDAFAFVDPPYLQAVRKGYYGINEVMPSDIAAVLRNFKGKWMVTYGNSSVVVESFADVTTKMMVHKAPYESRVAPLEIVLANYDFGELKGLKVVEYKGG